jgi:branched-chain amino acid aminotransferase
MGDGVFDTARTFRHRPYKLREHLERLYRSLYYIRIDPGIMIEEMEAHTLQVVEHNVSFLQPHDDVWITQVISRGPLRTTGAPTVVILTEPLPFASFARYHKLGVALITPGIRYTPPQSVEPRAKTVSRMNLVLAELEAQQRDPEAWALLWISTVTSPNIPRGTFSWCVRGNLITPFERKALGGFHGRW